ncbi:flagellar hook-associated protein 2 [Allopusillimonas soli]|uniref:Flagellar hook-associated protein 2 n=1 Tax=Allopusillimonas soli TaxID=659016 RepID=A0A853F6N0_9BURK|nr:flagellar filament capping protein FliD [Allopusillimonas soli]NYT35498.1 flagellar filament capping protein FliD [Allopusillimonas soli]TEA75909.1 flagellar hook-associated protein 2 [Allopusillimonas soli]
MAISSIGVGSGLPLDDLLKQLRTAENQSLSLIQERAKSQQARLSGYGTIKSAVEALQTAAQALGKSDTFGAMATSVKGDSFSASAQPPATAGQYTISVQQLATPQTLSSPAAGYARVDTPAGSDLDITVTLANGDTETVHVTQANSSLEGVVKAINEHPALGLRATIINDGGDTPYHLQLTATDTGPDAAVQTIAVAGLAPSGDPGAPNIADMLSFDRANPSSNLTETAARQAQLTINGIAVVSDSNTVKHAIAGVTLTLDKLTASGATETLSVSANNEATAKAINSFVSAYNSLQGVIKTLTSYDVTAQTGAALSGDSVARQVQSRLRDALNTVSASGTLRTLSQIGITTNPKDGTLTIDNEKLSGALAGNPADVRNLFAGEQGIGARMAAAADDFVKSGGVLATVSDHVTDTLKDLEKQYDAASARIDAKMENYRKQFVQLDAMVAQMNSVSSYLTQQLSMLGSLSKES